jgi:hypothetical protein
MDIDTYEFWVKKYCINYTAIDLSVRLAILSSRIILFPIFLFLDKFHLTLSWLIDLQWCQNKDFCPIPYTIKGNPAYLSYHPQVLKNTIKLYVIFGDLNPCKNYLRGKIDKIYWLLYWNFPTCILMKKQINTTFRWLLSNLTTSQKSLHQYSTKPQNMLFIYHMIANMKLTVKSTRHSRLLGAWDQATSSQDIQ